MNAAIRHYTLFCLLAVLFLSGCGEESEDRSGEFAWQAVEAERRLSETHAELAQSREELARQRADLDRTREHLQAAQDRADHMAESVAIEQQERRGAEWETEAAESDFYAAFAITFGILVVAVLFFGLFVKEHRSRRVLSKLLHWLRRRDTA